MTQALVDRFEGGDVVLLVGRKSSELQLSADCLPTGVGEGMRVDLQIEHGKLVGVAVDHEQSRIALAKPLR